MAKKASADLRGADFVACEPLFGPLGEVVAAEGDTCEQVPASSLGWLLEGGHIKPVTGSGAKPASPRVAAEEGD